MTVATSTVDRYDDGYPRSSEADLDPGSSLTESLDDADRAMGQEQRFTPEGQRPDCSVEDDERFEESDGVDDADSRHELAGGRV